MVIQWKERGNEVEYHHAAQDPNCIVALRECGLLKFFCISWIRSQVELLQHLVSWWDVDHQLFMIGYQDLEIDIAYIYFIMAFPQKGT